MKIAILGIRGIPANYSAFEACVEELAPRLIEKGHKVVVYCRRHYVKTGLKYYKGAQLIILPTIRNKYLDTFVHSLFSTLHVIFTDANVVQYFGVGNSIFTIVPRLLGKKTFINVDGLDWTRKKWPYPAKLYLKFSSLLATIFPNNFITDSGKIVAYYQKNFLTTPCYISYGTNIACASLNNLRVLDKFGLEKNKYILFSGRLVPENNIHHLILAYLNLETAHKLVIAGEGTYETDYIKQLKNFSGAKVIFTGFLTGEDYRDICCNAYLFVEPTEASGTHTAILDAMGYGNCVLVNNTPSNLEVIGDAGFSYDGSLKELDLIKKLKWLMENPAIIKDYKLKAVEWVRRNYSWDKVANLYERLYLS